MALTQVSTGGIKDATVATADIAADAVTGAKIADDAVGAEHIEQLDADLTFADSAKAIFGAGSDLKIYHDTTDSNIEESGPGELRLRTNTGAIRLAKDATETLAAFNVDGSSDLYYDNSKKFETTNYGALLTGQLYTTDYIYIDNGQSLFLQDNGKLKIGSSQDLQIYHDGTSSFIDTATSHDLYIRSTQGNRIRLEPRSGENGIQVIADGAVELYHDNSKKLETTSDGGKITGELDVHKSGTGDVFHVQGNGTGAVVAKVENAYNSDNDRFAILELKSGKGSIRFNSNGDSNEGAITYNMADNTMVFGVNNASEKLRIQSGGGISFNGDTAAANALDDYEEGTWSPGIDRAASSVSGVSYSYSTGTYTKVGRLVTVWFDFSVSSGATSGSGNYYITELPFTASYGSGGGTNNGGYGAPTFRDATLTTSDLRVYGNSSYIANRQIYLQHYNSNGDTATTTCNASGRISGQATYFAA